MSIAETTTAHEDIVIALVKLAIRDVRKNYQESNEEQPAYAFLHALGVLEQVRSLDTLNIPQPAKTRSAAQGAAKSCFGPKGRVER